MLPKAPRQKNSSKYLWRTILILHFGHKQTKIPKEPMILTNNVANKETNCILVALAKKLEILKDIS